MKLNKKIPIFIVLLLFIFSGCARFDVDLGIDSNYTAFLSYRLEMDISEFNEHQQHNFRVALHEIAIHYQDELGFSVGLDIESSPITLTTEKRINNNSFEEAFEALESMLTDADMSIFMMVDMGMISYPRQLGYVFEAIADIPRIIESHDTENLPTAFQAGLEDAIYESSGTISISLPADELVSSSHLTNINNGQATMSVPLSFSEQTAFDLSATVAIPVSPTDGSIGAIIEQQLVATLGSPDETTVEQHLRFRNIARNVTVAAAALIALTLIVTFVVVLIKKLRAG